MRNLSLRKIYDKLLLAYGEQGWWPIHGCGKADKGDGYHPGYYDFPRTAGQRFEVIIGAVLTQNTAWHNVQGVIAKLEQERLFSPEGLLALPQQELASLIRPTGYYNQKAIKLQAVSRFFLNSDYLHTGKAPARDVLLAVWGVGPETADSILLYAFNEPVFVVDAYTRRLLVRLGWSETNSPYAEIQSLFMKSIEPRTEIYNEYHALLVQHAKLYCRKVPLCAGCPLRKFCLEVRKND